jgi:hypothetical protein
MRTDGQTDTTKLKVDLRNCANVSYDMILKCNANVGDKYSVGDLVILMKLSSDER